MSSSSLSNLIGLACFILLSASVYAKTPELGVAIDPLKIKVKPNRMVYFSLINDTENDYIVTTKAFNTLTKKDTVIEPLFLVNPPIRLLKKRDKVKMGVVYLSERRFPPHGSKFYLSVSFIPKVPEKSALVHMPVILVQQVPLVFE
ncbi:TPA: fimbria/pilus periplasmic chaperone [Escherichia coli]|nr:fimbria/pilus periplasmic chaperone [Escherichia coli]HBS6784951.1 fimbria/pilus periplasmic chaperone [Klebsiella pneumoniae]EFC3517481.1 fimbria/pilus periplasmic chaperone [Escherichia coli]EIO2238708.1 fimbria/pilus periplasmic chaperone [Escherichia coli]EKI2793829.1 fimbria/pilus periplasmic chaperone [Escherichia coli]